MRTTGHSSREPAAAQHKPNTSATVRSAAVPRTLARVDAVRVREASAAMSTPMGRGAIPGVSMGGTPG